MHVKWGNILQIQQAHNFTHLSLLSSSVARDAARLWRSVLQVLEPLPTSLSQHWPLQLAAAESRMLVHSGVLVGVNPSDPTAPGNNYTCINKL